MMRGAKGWDVHDDGTRWSVHGDGTTGGDWGLVEKLALALGRLVNDSMHKGHPEATRLADEALAVFERRRALRGRCLPVGVMAAERRLQLIAMLAGDSAGPQAWDAVVLIGRELLDAYYPADVFTGTSGESGPRYVVALRELLAEFDKDGGS
jgi:hypothetical protein